jgi:hypothetical protein
MTDNPTTGIDPDGLESAARGELGAKSLGAKLAEALGYDLPLRFAANRDFHEHAALAFAASLTHDETANAVTLSLISALRASQQVAKEQAEEAERLRKVLADIAMRAVIKVGEHGQDSAEQRLRAIYNMADGATTFECYCGGAGPTPKQIGHRDGCPDARTRPSGGDAGGEEGQ